MKKMIMWTRSIIFCPLFYLHALIVIGGLMWTFVLPRKKMLFVPKWWCIGNRFLLRWVVGIKVDIKGLENLPKKQGYIVAAKHQSAMETVLLHMLVPNTIYVLKQSLLFLPIAGWYMIKTGCIPIDRNQGAKSLKKMLNISQKRLKDGFNIIIFPEGTRTKPGTKTNYHTGLALIYKQCQVPVVPLALNTGLFWPKNSFKRIPGTATFEFLPPIEPGMDKQAFMDRLENDIETHSDKLLDKAKIDI